MVAAVVAKENPDHLEHGTHMPEITGTNDGDRSRGDQSEYLVRLADHGIDGSWNPVCYCSAQG